MKIFILGIGTQYESSWGWFSNTDQAYLWDVKVCNRYTNRMAVDIQREW